jgi:serine/threonine protein kinase
VGFVCGTESLGGVLSGKDDAWWVNKMMRGLQDDENVYMVTPYYPGGDLFARLEKRVERGKGGVSEARACAFLLQILDGLDYIRSKGYAHG